jgi:hypothetical protein
VRSLERTAASVIRGVAVKVAEGDISPRVVQTEEHLREYLGPIKYTSEVAERVEETGSPRGSPGPVWAGRSSSSRSRACSAPASCSSPDSSVT